MITPIVRLRPRVLLALVASAVLAACAVSSDRAAGTPPGWRLVWQDEFDAPVLDTARWDQETGGDGWGNAELEFYTDHGRNARVADGQLVIEARHERRGGRDYTSARLKSAAGGAWRYGRIEARIQIPKGQG